MPVKLPIRFPDEADKMNRDAQAFRQLSSTARFDQILALMAAGHEMLAMSPNREAIIAHYEAEEEVWRRAHRELFRRHGF